MPWTQESRRQNRYILTEVEIHRLAQEICQEYPHLRPEAFEKHLPMYRPLTRGQLRSAVRRLLIKELRIGSADRDLSEWVKLLLGQTPDPK